MPVQKGTGMSSDLRTSADEGKKVGQCKKATFRWLALKLGNTVKFDMKQRKQLFLLWKNLERKSWLDDFLFEQCLIMFHYQNIRSKRPCPSACLICGTEYVGCNRCPEEALLGCKLE